MTNRQAASVALGLCLLLALAACTGDDGAAPTPCTPTPASARFKIFEVLDRPRGALLVETDTAATGTFVRFVPDQAGQVSYAWRIGDELSDRTLASPTVVFPTLVQPINVRLRTTRTDACTRQLTRDSITRTAALMVQPWDPMLVFGYYQGALSSAPADTFTIALDYRSVCPADPSCREALFLDNLPRGFKGFRVTLGDEIPSVGYKKMALFRENRQTVNLSNILFIRGLMQFSDANARITVSFETNPDAAFPSSTTSPTQTFTGKRL